MRKLYEKDEIMFAVLWILVYCFALNPIRGNLGDDSIWMTIVLLVIAALATVFIKKNRLEKKYGLTGWPRNTKRYLFFIPMWILATGNLWGGFGIAYDGMGQVFAVVSMILVGYVEEVIFRGFLFKALISKNGIKPAIIISSVTFGLGHIINLLSGHASLETVIQVFFAIGWGFIFTIVFYKCQSLIPCIIAHSLIDVFSLFVNESHNDMTGRIYMGVTILVAIVYGIYLAKQPGPECAEE